MNDDTNAEITAIVERLTKSSYLYHNGLPGHMGDDEYDNLLDTLKRLDPENPFLFKVGAPVAEGDEIVLPFPMPSSDKLSLTLKALEKWLSANPAEEYIITGKLDGISALWLPQQKKLYTRGDGLKGRDISHLAPHISGLPTSNIGRDLRAIRGELILKKSSPLVPIDKLARNIVAGLLNRKELSSDMKEVIFVAYEVVSPPNLKPMIALSMLQEQGYEIVATYTNEGSSLSFTDIEEIFAEMESGDFEMDGLIIQPNIARSPSFKHEIRTSGVVNPKDKIAWKPIRKDQILETTVIEVEWNVSKDGNYIPIVHYEPVRVSGAILTKATGIHAQWIRDNGVGPGAFIAVRRANDTIPRIERVIEKVEPSLPSEEDAEWEGVHMKVIDKNNEAMKEAQLLRTLKSLKVENVGPAIVSDMYKKGFKTAKAIYQASQSDFIAKLDRCGEKKASQIWEGLRVGISQWNELVLLDASGVFPRLVGETKLKSLLDLTPNPESWIEELLLRMKPRGISNETLSLIISKIPAYIVWRDDFMSLFGGISSLKATSPQRTSSSSQQAQLRTPIPPPQALLYQSPFSRSSLHLQQTISSQVEIGISGSMPAQSTSPPSLPSSLHSPLPEEVHRPETNMNMNRNTYVFAFTGFRDGGLKQLLESRGHIVKDDVTRATTHLISKRNAGDAPEETGKTKKASQYGVPIISIEQAMNM